MTKNEIVAYMDLEVWNLAHELVLEIYKVTKNFPIDERFGLTYQLRKASSSIPANIAEGNGRQGTREYIQFLYISKASLNEAKYFVLLSRDLDYLKGNKYFELKEKLDRIEKMLMGLIKSLKNKLTKKSKNKKKW
jgi:four helix bundle protein